MLIAKSQLLVFPSNSKSFSEFEDWGVILILVLKIIIGDQWKGRHVFLQICGIFSGTNPGIVHE